MNPFLPELFSVLSYLEKNLYYSHKMIHQKVSEFANHSPIFFCPVQAIIPKSCFLCECGQVVLTVDSVSLVSCEGVYIRLTLEQKKSKTCLSLNNTNDLIFNTFVSIILSISYFTERVTVVIYLAFCLDVAQGLINVAPNETRTHYCLFASQAC